MNSFGLNTLPTRVAHRCQGARRNLMGLLSEDFAPATGELRGQLPQTHSMVGIFNGAVHLCAPWAIAV